MLHTVWIIPYDYTHYKQQRTWFDFTLVRISVRCFLVFLMDISYIRIYIINGEIKTFFIFVINNPLISESSFLEGRKLTQLGHQLSFQIANLTCVRSHGHSKQCMLHVLSINICSIRISSSGYPKPVLHFLLTFELTFLLTANVSIWLAALWFLTR